MHIRPHRVGICLLGLAVGVAAIVQPAHAARRTTRPAKQTSKPAPNTAVRSSSQPERTERIVVQLGGKERVARLVIPARTGGASLPLVVVLHGGGGSGSQVQRSTGFDDLARSKGFAVVFPDAIDGNWNDGRDNRAANPTADDLGFMRALITEATGRFGLDPKRVFVTGISNGAMMSLRVACEAPQLVAGVAAVAGTVAVGIADECRSSASVPLMQIHGSDDPLVPYAGGAVRGGLRSRGDVIGVDALAELFAAKNRCSGPVVVDDRTDVDTKDGSTVSTRSWTSCDRGASDLFVKVNGGGHTWPGERTSGLTRLVGTTNRDIDATAEIWSFFANLPPR